MKEMRAAENKPAYCEIHQRDPVRFTGGQNMNGQIRGHRPYRPSNFESVTRRSSWPLFHKESRVG